MLNKVLTILGYALGAVIVVGGTFLLIAYGKGYSYDFKHGRLLSRGLLILDSAPNGTKVHLDGKALNQKTPYRKTLEAGRYELMLARDGYHTWKKHITIVPTLVSVHQYVILIPEKLTTKTLASFEATGQTLPSADNHRLAIVVPTGTKTGIWSLDTGNDQLKQIYTPTIATDTKPAESVELVQWSEDNSHLLIRSKVGDTTAYVVVAANGNDVPVNITTTFNIAPTSLQFSPSNWRQLYWQNENGLQRLDLGNKTISAVLADHVLTYTFAGDRVLYVRNATLPALWALETNGRTHELIHDLPVSNTYELAYTSYNGSSELAVVAQESRQTTLYSDIDEQPTALTLPATGTHALFNGDGRFLVQSDENHVATYDLQELTTYTFPATIEPITGINWFDTYHLLYNTGGKATLSEFDGNYALPLALTDGLMPISSPDTKSVIVTAPSGSGPMLVRSITVRD